MTYPQPLDLPDDAIRALGSFWSARDRDPLLRNLITARLLQDRHALGLLDDYRNSFSRQKCPLLQHHESRLVRLRESDRSSTDSMYRYGDLDLYYDGQTNYGQLNTEVFTWSLPPGMIDIALIVDRLEVSTVTWTGGVDYRVEDGKLIFTNNPFNTPGVPVHDVLVDDVVVDREIWVWLYGCSFDLNYLYNFYGFAVGLPTQSTEIAKRAVNSVYDAITKTNVITNTTRMLASITDTGFAEADGEVVEHVFYDADYLWVVTDKQSHRASPNATAVVAVGDVLKVNAPLTDAAAIYSLHRGVLPIELPLLSVQEEWIGIEQESPVNLSNTAVPVVCTANGDTGFLEVRFDLCANDGWIWDEIRQREVDQGISLAKVMTGRGPDDTEPVPADLPATIKPMEWFVRYFLRNAYLVVVRTSKRGRDALPLSALNRLRHASAPHIWYVVVIIADVDLPAFELPPTEADTLDIVVVTMDEYELSQPVVTVEATGVSCR